jgi:hypothetical protein
MSVISAPGGYSNIPWSLNQLDGAQRGIRVGSNPTAPFDFTTFSLVTANEQEGNREAEDVILTSLVGFDVKGWDPAAPVFRVRGDADNPNIVGCVMPGDPGYIPAVKRFLNAPQSPENMPVSFGAYADLNFLGNLASQSTFTFNVSSTNFPVNRYYLALGEMAKSVPGRYTMPYFAGPGDATSKVSAMRDGTFIWTGSTYDTFSRHYEYDGFPAYTLSTALAVNLTHTSKRLNQPYSNDILIDAGMNGIDDNGNGLVDEPYERDAPPPYEKPLRGIRVSIRVIEPDSKAIRQATVVHEFIPL